MRRFVVTVFLLGSLGVGTALGACGGDADGDGEDAGVGDEKPVDPDDEGINSTGSGAGTGSATGLPCDVQQLLENRCIGCHLIAVPPPLLDYDDLMKPAPSDPSKTMAQKAVERMKSVGSPMPPKPAVPPTPAEIATFEAWVKAGTPKNNDLCTTRPGTDGGTVEAGTAGTNYNTPLVCTSNVTWKPNLQSSPVMRPGGACITCHTMRGGPAFTIAGPVYPTAHEPNNCHGINGAGLKVVVTDKNGVVTDLTVNASGNFYSTAPLVAPFRAKVVSGAKERSMAGSVTAGDCNSCHTATGVNGAPGRIMAP
jgi:hypothetical protein